MPLGEAKHVSQRRPGCLLQVLARADVYCHRLRCLEDPSLSTLWVLVNLSSVSRIYVCLYRSHSGDTETSRLFEHLSRAFDEAQQRFPYADIVLLGDFNAHHETWLSSTRTDHAGRLAHAFALPGDGGQQQPVQRLPKQPRQRRHVASTNSSRWVAAGVSPHELIGGGSTQNSYGYWSDFKMMKNIKAFYNKEGYDYTKGFGSPKEFHKTFYFLIDAFQVIDEPYSVFSYISKFYVIVCGMGVFIDAFLSFYHGFDLQDIFLLTEAGAYVILMLYKLMIVLSTYINLKSYHKLIRAIKTDFEYVNTKELKYREIFFKINLTTWKASVWTVIFMILLGTVQIAYASGILAYYYIVHTPGDGRVRQLVFPFWAPGIDFTKTPAFEFAFTFANIGVAAYSYNYCFILTTDIVWIRQIATKAEMIIQCLKDLLVDIEPARNEEENVKRANIIRLRMKEIIPLTQAMFELIDDYAAVYKKMLMFEQFFASPMISILAYCSAAKLDAGEVHAIMMMLCVGSSITLYIPCYLCTFLRSKITAVSDACWYTPFWNAGPEIRPYIVLIMKRCLRPLPFQAPGFQEVSIKTFSSKMTSAYSMFNMLRQIDIEF